MWPRVLARRWEEVVSRASVAGSSLSYYAVAIIALLGRAESRWCVAAVNTKWRCLSLRCQVPWKETGVLIGRCKTMLMACAMDWDWCR